MSHVLIVDDEPAICWAFRECLTDEGFSVDIAGTAEQALTMADLKQPDVIVLDVRLPGIDGFQAMQEFRRKSKTVPIIIVTAFGSLKTAVSAIDGGAFDYLTKPIDLDKALAIAGPLHGKKIRQIGVHQRTQTNRGREGGREGHHGRLQ